MEGKVHTKTRTTPNSIKGVEFFKKNYIIGSGRLILYERKPQPIAPGCFLPMRGVERAFVFPAYSGSDELKMGLLSRNSYLSVPIGFA
jgi:hypothetical protein